MLIIINLSSRFAPVLQQLVRIITSNSIDHNRSIITWVRQEPSSFDHHNHLFHFIISSVLLGDNPSSVHYPRAMAIRIDYYPARERILTLTLPSVEGQWVTPSQLKNLEAA